MVIMFIRKKNRLPNKHLYEGHHWYFVTICTKERECILGNINIKYNNIKSSVESDTVGHNTVGHIHEIQLSPIGIIIQNIRYTLPQMFGNIVLDQFIIMPNHIHGIIQFEGMPISLFTQENTSLGNIIKRFKVETISQGKEGGHITDSFRQKSFYDHIIRDQKDLERIQEYIYNNPDNRQQDKFYTSS